MECLGVISVLYKLVCHLLCLHLGAAEDDAIDAWEVVHHAFQRQILILGVDHIIYMVHVLRTLVT